MISVIAVAGIGLARERFLAARNALGRLRERQGEQLRMAGLRPAPTVAAAVAMADELARLRNVVAGMETALTGSGPATRAIKAEKIPTTRTDAYFDLAAFAERTREFARTQRVALAPAASNFGFSAYATEAPETGHIAAVFRQRIGLEHLLRALLESGPRAVLAIKRERPRHGKEPAERGVGGETEGRAEPMRGREVPLDGPDYFSLDPSLGVAAPGGLETTAFRLVFSGETATLRAYLNRLTGLDRAILIRGVEVEPAGAAEAIEAGREQGVGQRPPPTVASYVLRENGGLGTDLPPDPAARDFPAVPIIARTCSRFTVTVAYVELAGAREVRGDGSLERELLPEEPWLAPEAQSRGPDWIYEMFTPPEIYYHAPSGRFTVHPPGRPEREQLEPFGVDVLSVRPETFRVRLIGYVGAEGNWRGAFEDTKSGGIFLAGNGSLVVRYGVEVGSVEVRRQPVRGDVGVGPKIGASFLRDIDTGLGVTLTEGLPATSGTMVAVVAVAGEETAREVRVGDRFQAGGFVYTIEAIGESPPLLTITKNSPARAQPERRVLVAPGAGAPPVEENP